MKRLKWLVGVVVSISIFITMLITAVDWAVCHNEEYFQKEFEKYNVEETTKADMTSLLYVADEMMKYLQGEREDLVLPVTIHGEVTEFFSERAKEHMVDVRNLFLMAISIRRICIVLILAGILYLMVTRQQWAKVISKCFNIVSAVIAGVSVVLAILIAMDFSNAFTVFHHIFFKNDLWLLEEDDTLVNLVPEGFFLDTSIRIGLIFLGLFIAGLSLSIIYKCMFTSKKFQKKTSNMERIITDYKVEKEEVIVSIEEGKMNWEKFKREEAVRDRAYQRLRQGKKYSELYVDDVDDVDDEEVTQPLKTDEVAHENMETEEPEKVQEQALAQPETMEPYEEHIEMQELEVEAEEEAEKVREEVEEEEPETEPEAEPEVEPEVEPQEIEEGEQEESEAEEAEEGETEEEPETEPEVEPEEEPQEVEESEEEDGEGIREEAEPEIKPEVEPEEEPQEVEESEEEDGEGIREEVEPEIEPEVEPEVELQEVEESEEEDGEGIREEAEPEIKPEVEPEEEPQEIGEETEETEETEEAEEIEEAQEAQEEEQETEIIDLDEPELEIIHADDMEVVEDNRLAIKGIELEKARLEGERLRRQYGIPYEEISPEEEKSLQERMQQLMDEYNVIQP